jgi:hypothetical protein
MKDSELFEDLVPEPSHNPSFLTLELSQDRPPGCLEFKKLLLLVGTLNSGLTVAGFPNLRLQKAVFPKELWEPRDFRPRGITSRVEITQLSLCLTACSHSLIKLL